MNRRQLLGAMGLLAAGGALGPLPAFGQPDAVKAELPSFKPNGWC